MFGLIIWRRVNVREERKGDRGENARESERERGRELEREKKNFERALRDLMVIDLMG